MSTYLHSFAIVQRNLAMPLALTFMLHRAYFCSYIFRAVRLERHRQISFALGPDLLIFPIRH